MSVYAPERPSPAPAAGPLRIGSLCSGYGGLDKAVEAVFGAVTTWVCQYEPPDKHGREDKNQYAARIVAARFPGVPNHGDITKVDCSKVAPIDILCAGFPCQDVSLAGKRAGLVGDVLIPAGMMACGCYWAHHAAAACEAASPSGAVPAQLAGEAAEAAVAELNARDLADPAGPPPERIVKGNRSGLWAHVARFIKELNPRLVVIENVQGLLSSKAVRGVGSGAADVDAAAAAESGAVLRALGAVLADLAGLGFDAEWQVVRASEVGAPHQRPRVILLAWRRAAADSEDFGLAGPGEARGRRYGPADDGVAAADAPGERHGNARPAGERGIPAAAFAGGVAAELAAAADADGWGLEGDQERHGEPVEEEPEGESRLDPDGCGVRRGAAADAGRLGRGAVQRDVQRGEPDAGGGAAADSDDPGLEGPWGRQGAAGGPAVERGRGPAGGPGEAAADADGDAVWVESVGLAGGGGEAVAGDAGAEAAADAAGVGRGEGRPESAGVEGGPDAAERGGFDWGDFEPAIRRWEYFTGRPAPSAVDDRGRLSPLFVEWMMGLPEGWVTGVPGLPRAAQLKALGNGVVPQQAAAALVLLLERIAGEVPWARWFLRPQPGATARALYAAGAAGRRGTAA